MAGIVPLADRVLVKRSESADKTRGGLWIPEAAKEKMAEGTVVAVGPGRLDIRGNVIPIPVEEGDKILFSKHVGIDVQLEDEEYIIIGEYEILGKVT